MAHYRPIDNTAARRRPGHGVVFIIDEVGQYVARSVDKIEGLRAVVEQFGVQSKNRVQKRQAVAPVWVIVTSQEKLDEVVAAIDDKRVELPKLQDRFRIRVDMAPADIREVATRRVLAKRPEAEGVLSQVYERHAALLLTHTKLERTARRSDIDRARFIEHYPYLPHFIDLSIDIVSGIRLLRSDAPRHVGGSNRTIIKQTYEMLVGPRTGLAERPIGALVTLDRIYDLVEGNLPSERQRDIVDIQQRWPDTPWPARVAKAIVLLEYVRDLPRTEANLAVLLYDELGAASPLPQVHDALARLKDTQFIHETESGQFQACFRRWVAALEPETIGQVVAVDGKRARRSHDRANGQGPLQMVSAWATDSHLVLGQRRVEAGQNEVSVLPELLTELALAGCTVTIDAIACHAEMAQTSRDQGADYVLAIKDNQPKLHGRLKQLFSRAPHGGLADWQHDQYQTVEKGHGRIETRDVWTVSDPEWLGWLDPNGQWPDLGCGAMVVRQRRIGEVVSVADSYFITSLSGSAQVVGQAIRAHGQVENGLHWVLDIAFREDESRVRVGHAQANLAILRHMALSLLKQETTLKRGLKTKRLKAGWDNAYLRQVLLTAQTN